MVPLKATTLGAWYHSTVYELSLATPFSVQSLVHSCPDVQQQSSECLGELSPWTGLPIHCQTESKQRCALCVHGASKRLPKPLPIELAGATTTELPNASNSSLAPTAHRHQGREGSSERNEGCLHTTRSLGAPAISLPCGPQASIYLGAQSPSSPLRSPAIPRAHVQWMVLAIAGGSHWGFLHLWTMQSRAGKQWGKTN